MLWFQGLQDRRPVRGDDLPYGDGRLVAVCLHLPGVRHGLFTRYAASSCQKAEIENRPQVITLLLDTRDRQRKIALWSEIFV